MAVDKALVANLLHLNGLQEYEPFRKWLMEQRDIWRDALETQRDSDVLRVAQGKAQAFKQILELLAEAPALAEKYRN